MARNAAKPITMAAIAREAGVARTTVSFVLNGRYRQHGISEKTAEKILAIAQRRNFVPNETARSLSRQRTGLVGVFLPGFNSHWGETVVRGIRARLFEDGDYIPLIASQHDDPDWEEREVRVLLERQVEAIVCCPTVKSSNYRRIVDRGVPLVFIGHRAQGISEASFVAWDGTHIAAEATRYLMSHGRKRIAFIGRDESKETFRERFNGYREALKEGGLSARRAWKKSVPDYSDAGPAIRSLFAQKAEPDAILCDLWIQALAAIEALDEIGRNIPEDVAVMALGDSPVCAHGRVGLTTVAEPAEHLGRRAAEIALQLIRSPSSVPVQELIRDYELRSRQTV